MLLVLLGTSLSKRDDPDKKMEAIECFERASKEQPENVLAWRGLCSTFHGDRVDLYVRAVKKVDELLPAEMAEDVSQEGGGDIGAARVSEASNRFA